MKKILMILVAVIGFSLNVFAQSVDVYKSKFTGSGYENVHVGTVSVTVSVESNYAYTIHVYNGSSEFVKVYGDFERPQGTLNPSSFSSPELAPQGSHKITVLRGKDSDGNPATIEGITNLKAIVK
ncbi:MAG: hypothetical protein LBQ28_03945 [Prevotellaceae bacterium]|jgi:hypothetical protein|nr:hypothetical protein [Prevotellaceae bacterium]